MNLLSQYFYELSAPSFFCRVGLTYSISSDNLKNKYTFNNFSLQTCYRISDDHFSREKIRRNARNNCKEDDDSHFVHFENKNGLYILRTRELKIRFILANGFKPDFFRLGRQN